MSVWNISEVHKDYIKAGDIILHEGKEMTVSKNNITRCDFFGIKIFGDSYRLGYKLVKKLIYNNPMNKERF